jgi:hypothetical protein
MNKENSMANEKLINLRDLQVLLDQHAGNLRGRAADSLDNAAGNAQAVPVADIDRIVGAMDALSVQLGTICQQGVLAIRTKDR